MITRKLMLYFPECETEKPIVYRLVKDYDLMVNIYRAKVTPEESGYLLLDITGDEAQYGRALEYLQTMRIEIHQKDKGLRWESEKCVSCGACLTFCPTKALSVESRATMKVSFEAEKCIECLKCIAVCPFDACSSVF